ncbi:TlyA family RNA methyltransferase [Rubrobacter indicoceani]|uniref:TlyA family RNA methyltransferase n=1 Tax=Rubrobacter indicoceani TaxID=2051957 RepID=UPI000E5B79D3|nr:TlyA family RNA methyltransferase [Rubrobacter indicoceani]
MKDRTRLDAALVALGLAENRSKAQAVVISGSVRVGGEVATKPGLKVSPDAEITLKEDSRRYVSRAGEKLARALDDFGVDAADRLCLDAGASTGGFTDVLLRRGAKEVCAVDVGYGQFDWRLRNDGRVAVMERTNVRNLRGENLPFAPDLLVSDLSFISLSVALGGLLSSTPSIREAVLLVKPQFEAGPDLVGRGGLVSDRGVHAEVVTTVAESFDALGFGAVGVVRSATRGRKSGNQEYVMRLFRGQSGSLSNEKVLEVVGGV